MVFILLVPLMNRHRPFGTANHKHHGLRIGVALVIDVLEIEGRKGHGKPRNMFSGIMILDRLSLDREKIYGGLVRYKSKSNGRIQARRRIEKPLTAISDRRQLD